MTPAQVNQIGHYLVGIEACRPDLLKTAEAVDELLEFLLNTFPQPQPGTLDRNELLAFTKDKPEPLHMLPDLPEKFRTAMVMRYVLGIRRVQFNPQGMKHWDKFAAHYSDLIIL